MGSCFPFRDAPKFFRICKVYEDEEGIGLIDMQGYPYTFEEVADLKEQINSINFISTKKEIDALINARKVHDMEVRERERNAAEVKPQRIPKRGFIYVIRMDTGVYKIGRSASLKARLDSYRTHSLKSADLVHSVEVIDMVLMENEIHKTFEDQRIDEREMFKLSDDDIEMIKTFHHQLANAGVDLRV